MNRRGARAFMVARGLTARQHRPSLCKRFAMTLSLRASLAALILSLLAAEASAATLVKQGSASRASERGVTVIRGAKPPALPLAAAPAPRAACPPATAVVATVWPARRFRQQGFWSGDGLVTASMRAARRPATHGFYADRMAAGD
jgi:hypothetical protein